MYTKEQQKQLAVKYLQEMGVYNPYINYFSKKGIVTMFEHCVGFCIDTTFGMEQETVDKINAQIKKQEEYGNLVYAVTHEYTDFGEIYDLLLVSPYEEDTDFEQGDRAHTFLTMAYAYNDTDEWCSDMGTIMVGSLYGGLQRIA